MKIYTLLSPSHEFLFKEVFEKSVKEYEPKAEIIVIDQDQICKTGTYYDHGWKEAMEQKIDAYLKALESKDEFFIWSDVDIEFYEPFIDECVNQLGHYDIAFQEGIGSEYCAGFFIARINNNTKQFFELLKKRYQEYPCDQTAINANIRNVNATFLSKLFYNISFQHRQWSGQEFEIKRPRIMFHANYTVGIQNKLMLLGQAKQKNIELKTQEQKVKLEKKEVNIKILEAFYGKREDVTGIVKKINPGLIINVNSEFFQNDPLPGATKYLYIFDKDKKLLSQPIQERLQIQVK